MPSELNLPKLQCTVTIFSQEERKCLVAQCFPSFQCAPLPCAINQQAIWSLPYSTVILMCVCYRLRWSKGSVLAFGTQVHGFKPGQSRRIFKGEKILSTPSLGGEVKPSVPRCRFSAHKRSLELCGSRILDKICRKISRPRRVPPSAARGLSRRWT
jgi:hypothetical protein